MNPKEHFFSTLSIATVGSYLFYQSNPGVNHLVFTLLSIALLIHINKSSSIRTLLLACLPAILCSTFLIVYPQTITRIIWLFSYLLMWSSMTYSPYPLVILLQGIISIITSPFKTLSIKNITNTKLDTNRKNKQALVYLVALSIIITFSVLYINSNPVLGNLYSNIDFSFIQVGFVLSIMWLSFLTFGLLKISHSKEIRYLNLKQPLICKTALSEKDEQEYRIAKLSIWTISTILLFANSADLIVIFMGKLPSGVTYSQYVHQGFNTLIFTMSLAIGLVIYFYRGQLNFHSKISILKKACIFWIVQNLLLALITIYKNFLYVEVYGLTYKRIAVFLGLLCVIIGLILTIMKLQKPYSNWFYFNKLALSAYVSFILISFIPIDYTISYYNIEHSTTKDLDYILNLKKPNLILVKSYINNNEFIKSEYSVILEEKTSDLKRLNSTNKWQSWNYYNKYMTNQ